MKNYIKKITGLLILAIALCFIPMQANFNNDIVGEEIINSTADDLIGGWEYTVAGAPEGYDAGLMMIVKVEDTYKVQIQTGGGVMNGTDIVVKGNDISFKLMVEGESVSVELTAKGSTFTGTSSSSTGVFNLAGTKSISPQ